MWNRAQLSPLHELASLCGVQTEYVDVFRRKQVASAETLLTVLRAYGAAVTTLRSVPEALADARRQQWQRVCEPVLVAWNGVLGAIALQLPARDCSGFMRYRVRLESGAVRRRTCRIERLPTVRTATIDGTRFVAKRLRVPGTLPIGYHQLSLELRGGRVDSLVMAAPQRTFHPVEKRQRRSWGVFAPVYALHASQSWGGGDFADLKALMRIVRGHGGEVIGTLPLLASFLDEPCDPSPYTPASRLFWNEFFLDLAQIPEFRSCPEARLQMDLRGVRAERDALRGEPWVDYRRQMALKRRVLEPLAKHLFAKGSTARQESFRRFVRTNPWAEDYARFRATGEQQHRPWPRWPQPLRAGMLNVGDYDEAARQYHLYVQWLTHEQVRGIARTATRQQMKLYLDLPLGVHPWSYDVWREREVFALDASGGAPPDAVFTKGQHWGFPPLHPERLRQQGYRYYRAVVRHHLQHAGFLRIDHVMSFHRLYWAPRGLDAAHGAYVRYRADEFYAMLSVESHRAKAVIVGENLGTVPPEVNAAMTKHRLQKMFVVQYELDTHGGRGLQRVPRDVMASLNTHDMPPFATFWDERVRRPSGAVLIRRLIRGGWLDGGAVDSDAVRRACLAFLGASRGRTVLINLEDLWLEQRPQNIPGTGHEQPNWRRKFRFSLEEIEQLPEVRAVLQEIDQQRKGRTPWHRK